MRTCLTSMTLKEAIQTTLKIDTYRKYLHHEHFLKFYPSVQSFENNAVHNQPKEREYDMFFSNIILLLMFTVMQKSIQYNHNHHPIILFPCSPSLRAAKLYFQNDDYVKSGFPVKSKDDANVNRSPAASAPCLFANISHSHMDICERPCHQCLSPAIISRILRFSDFEREILGARGPLFTVILLIFLVQYRVLIDSPVSIVSVLF